MFQRLWQQQDIVAQQWLYANGFIFLFYNCFVTKMDMMGKVGDLALN